MGGGEDKEGKRDSGTAGFCIVEARGICSGARGISVMLEPIAMAHVDVMKDDARSEPPTPKS